jgi:hypothetical protein
MKSLLQYYVIANKTILTIKFILVGVQFFFSYLTNVFIINYRFQRKMVST